MSNDRSNTPSSLGDQAARDKLIAYLLEEEGIQRSTQHIGRRHRPDHPPLSFAQERLWFLDQLTPGNPVYNICRAERLTGQLNLEALLEALNEIVRRHEALRTTFPSVQGQSFQAINPAQNFTIPISDLQNLPKTKQDIEVARIISEEAHHSFDLACDPLLRVHLLRLESEEYVLIFTLHQIICDGWSLRVFFHEVESFYCAYSSGTTPALPDLPVQYTDYAAWQRDWLQGDLLAEQLSYWEQRLGRKRPVLALLADRSRPTIQTFQGNRQALFLPNSMSGRLEKLSQELGVSLFVTLITSFNVLLHRCTAQEDIIVGFPIANRNRAEIHSLIGLFVNTLPLRTNLSGSPSFRELSARIHDVCLEAYSHQDLPFEKLVEELQEERHLSQNPIFQAMFAFQNTVSSLRLPGVKIEPISTPCRTSKFDLTLSLVQHEGGLAGHFEYSTDLFDHSSIERMAGHFQTLFDSIVANPDQPISRLPLLTAAERHQLLLEWNDTAADYPKDSCIHELFEAQVERTPDAVAVEFEGEQLTYRELNRRANQLAHYLHGLGVGPERLVGICLERSLDMVVALLGILKAGGAYVPLNPAYPQERLAFMVDDAKLSLIISQQSLVNGPLSAIGGRLSTVGGPPNNVPDGRRSAIRGHQNHLSVGQRSAVGGHPRFVFLDSDWPLIERETTENPKAESSSHNLAYVTYTSGSTGKPKGVQVSHRSVVNCLCCIRDEIQITPADVFLAVTTISFDIAALELYLPLITGAKIILANREQVTDGKLLAEMLGQCGATVMQATPSGWRLLLEAGWRASEGFKVLCGGEILSRTLADQLLNGGASVWNLYGPTETTIWLTIAKVERDEAPILIGRPIANTQVYVLDSLLQPVPIGAPGELYIGGDGVARGYLNRPELTQEKFILNPFTNKPGDRLYRTGDLVRWRPNGQLQFLGRIDDQVKIRGYRVELGEIEAALNEHPAVRENVVVARVNGSPLSQSSPVEGEGVDEHDLQLVAYVVPASGAPSGSELRDFLRRKLPEFMLPSVFIPIEALPLTANGKIDRNALPASDGARPEISHVFVAPRTEIEELVAQIWREVLKLEKIGIYDNFFELGGHSLLATRVVARLRTAFNIDLPLRKLFELPTVAGLAEHVDLLRRTQSGISAPPIVPVPRDRPLPLSFSQRRLWFLDRLHPEFTAYNIPATWRIRGHLDVAALEQALNEILRRHEVLRTAIVETDGEPIQQVTSSTLSLPVIDLSHLARSEAEVEARRVSADDARQPYELEHAPLMRAKLLRLDEQEHVLILNFHHMIADGSSLAIFYQELATLYDAFCQGKPSPLLPLAVQYGDYAVWQSEQLQGDMTEVHVAYWKKQLGTATTPALPTDYDRPVLQTFRGAKLTRTLSEELTKSLKELSRREGVTVFMTLLAALNILLSRITGQTDVIVGSTIAGRNRREVEGLVGFFINALALRTDLSGNPSFLELLKRVREVCLEAYTHQDLPFEKVVEEINPQRDPSRNPLFQVMFNMADLSERVLTLSECKTTKLFHSEPSAKFDLTFYAPEIDSRIELGLVYNAELFGEPRMAALLEELDHLLMQAIEEPVKRIDDYSFVTASARTLLPDPTEPLDDTWEGAIHELFSTVAKREPHRLAVQDRNERWTYGELDALSNQLAHYFVTCGIRPKDVVAVYAHRSAPLALGLLAVLKAGAAFLILDPAYPPGRLIDYLRSGRPKGWIQLNAAGELPREITEFLDHAEMRCRAMLPGTKREISTWLDLYPATETGVTVSATSPAYIAFTSGSTGQPKGVLCHHGPITHFLPWQEKAFDVTAADRFSLLSGLAYNHLHRDLFTPLALGATLYVPDAETARDPVKLADWLRANEITVLHLTPALGRLLTSANQTLPSVRCIFFGGDVLTRQEVGEIRELAPNGRVGSFYGATETQRAVGYFEIPDDAPVIGHEAARATPLGRGIKDVQLLLLTANNQLAGIGELGELYVRSPHLAEGYLGDEKLTGEKFITNPFTNDPNDRLYRTGDVGRYLPDGTIEWAGRNDRCVNTRGFRVELEEIESVLKQHPSVNAAAVVLQDSKFALLKNAKLETRNPKPESRLVAYVVSTEEPSESLCDLLRSYLSARLPDYMVPAHFIILDHLPLTPNGKIDYLALPDPGQLSPAPQTSSEPPRTEAEKIISSIFAEVLGLEQVGVNENFFRLGGHSLLAAQATARLREVFHVSLDLRVFFEAPTAEGLAKEIEIRIKAVHQQQGTRDPDREEIEL